MKSPYPHWVFRDEDALNYKEEKIMDLRIKQALRFINENLDKNLTLEKLAKNSKLSYSYFSELFKKELNMCFSKYLMQTRIKKAKELLKDNSLLVKQISYRVGYRHIANFNHDFKKLASLSPSKYRRKYQKIILKYINQLAIKIQEITRPIRKKAKIILRFTK